LLHWQGAVLSLVLRAQLRAPWGCLGVPGASVNAERAGGDREWQFAAPVIAQLVQTRRLS